MPVRNRASGPSLALTGTPGTGKSTVGRILASAWTVREVGVLAGSLGCATGRGRAVTVDVRAVRRAWRRLSPRSRPTIVVGHLAHLLPLRDVVILRCHPRVLAGRLRRSRRGSAEERAANVVAEAVDVIRFEAIRAGRRVWEVDTTHASPRAIARCVARIVRDRSAPHSPAPDWLADPRVTDYLLRSVR
jgi:adenylate kinase